MIADGRIDVAPSDLASLLDRRGVSAYELVAGRKPSLGILLEYPAANGRGRRTHGASAAASPVTASPKSTSPQWLSDSSARVTMRQPG